MIKSFTLVEILIVVAVISMVAAIAIPGLLRARINAYEALVQESLRIMSAALETYYLSNNQYPDNIFQLTDANPPYLDSKFSNKFTAIPGYYYNYAFTAKTYVIEASPLSQITGTQSFSISTGGFLAVDVIPVITMPVGLEPPDPS